MRLRINLLLVSTVFVALSVIVACGSSAGDEQVAALTGSAGSTTSTPIPTPAPPTHIPEPRSTQDTLTSEERERIKARRGLPEWGPHTVGTVIEIAGRQVQLPEDVHVETVISTGLCAPGETCVDFPAWVLRRGDSLFTIGKQSGRPAPGREIPEAFDFLREALR